MIKIDCMIIVWNAH